MLGDTVPSEQGEVPRHSRRPRYVTIMLAHITLSSGDQIPCVIRDLSYGGAKLGVSRRYRLPERFKLSIPARGLTVHAHRVWQRGDFAGVRLPMSDANTSG